MIVSHQHKFIFIAIPKTATHAIRFALRPYLDENDWEQVELFHRSRLPFKEFENVTHGHITAQEAKRIVGDIVWNEYHKFTFVRNPYDRFVSYAFFKHKLSFVNTEYRLSMMKLMIQNPKIHTDILFKAQSDFINDNSGEKMLDFIGRFENLQDDFNLVCKKLGLPQLELKQRNKSDHEGFQQYYDEELRLTVASFFENDIDLFEGLKGENSAC